MFSNHISTHDLELETYFYYFLYYFVMHSLPEVCKLQIRSGVICFMLEERIKNPSKGDFV